MFSTMLHAGISYQSLVFTIISTCSLSRHAVPGSRAMETVFLVAVTQALGVPAPVVVIGAQGEEGGHVGLRSLGWMDLVTVGVGRFTVALQPPLEKPGAHLHSREYYKNPIH